MSDPEPDPLPEIDLDEAARRIDAGAPVIDVRQPDEYEEAHVAGARLIPLGELGDRMAEVPTERPVLVICQGGGRSAKATEALRGAGIDATNVAGGTRGWIESGRPFDTGPGID